MVVAVALRAIDALHPHHPVLHIVAHAHHGKQDDVAVGVVAGVVAQHPVGLRIVPHLVGVALPLGDGLLGPVAEAVVLEAQAPRRVVGFGAGDPAMVVVVVRDGSTQAAMKGSDTST